MCKRCELTTVNKVVGEKVNEGGNIARIKDGSQVFDVYLNRYVLDSMSISRADLMVELNIDLYGQEFTVKEKRIPIKYCPFCGERL